MAKQAFVLTDEISGALGIFNLVFAAALFTEIATIEQLVLNPLQRQTTLGAVLGPRYIRTRLQTRTWP
jgi:hypothetical protein